jgi:gluconolactonase
MIARIDRDAGLSELVRLESARKLCGGFGFTEGPAWIAEDNCLLFTDIPNNRIYRWRPGMDDAEVYREPSRNANGLTRDHTGNVLACEHSGRQLTRAAYGQPEVVLVDRFEGRRFNSPNDAVVHSSGAIYFTDPPYGLEKGGDVSTREIDFSGVYRIAPDGKVTMVTRAMTKPNGLALSPDEKTLYVGQSDRAAPLWRAFPVNDDGSLGEGKVFFDATPLVQAGKAGGPDGFKIDSKGNMFATGPGGVLVISPEGKHLGTIVTGDLTANCAFGGDDGTTLYITSNTRLCRIKTKTKGNGF